MRAFQDHTGCLWDVAVAQQSYGSLLLIFSPRSGGEIRQAPLSASTQAEAEGELIGMSEEQLRAELHRSAAWSG